MFITMSSIITHSQTNFFYSRGKKIPISVSLNAIVIKFKEGTTLLYPIYSVQNTFQVIKL